MRALSSVLFPTVLVSALVMPAIGMADEAHSWCFSGPPKSPSASTDSNTNAVVGHVCGLGGSRTVAINRAAMVGGNSPVCRQGPPTPRTL
jgi:hypothetical protein